MLAWWRCLAAMLVAVATGGRAAVKHLDAVSVAAIQSLVSGVSPLRGAGLSRCASSHRSTGVSPLTGVHP